MPSNVKTKKRGIVKLDKFLVLVSGCIVALVIPACHAGKSAFQELEAQAPDVTLYVRAAGRLESGNTLIAIHGGPGQSSHYMLNLERLAGPDLAVVTYDQRGVGRSTSVPPDPANFEMLEYIEDLEAVRRAVGAESVHLLGHSWGGVVALHYATVYPERVRSIVLANSGPLTWDGILGCASGIEKRFSELQKAGVIPTGLTPGTEEYGKAFLAPYFSDPTFWFSPEDEGGPPEYNHQVNQLTWSAARGFDLTSRVAELKHRVLVLWGEDDPCGLSVGESFEEALSVADVEFVLLEDCGHFWHECPDQFFPQVRAFLGLPGEP